MHDPQFVWIILNEVSLCDNCFIDGWNLIDLHGNKDGKHLVYVLWPKLQSQPSDVFIIERNDVTFGGWVKTIEMFSFNRLNFLQINLFLSKIFFYHSLIYKLLKLYKMYPRSYIFVLFLSLCNSILHLMFTSPQVVNIMR